MACITNVLLAFIAVPLVVLAVQPEILKDGGINLGSQTQFFEGDILRPPKMTRNGILKTDRWTDGIVPYFINPDSIRDWYTKEHVVMIEEAIKEIEKHTCVRFVPYTNQPNYVKIHAGGACFTTGVGMEKGENLVSLSSTGCMVHRIVIHELFHRIGLHHEQSRYDRDQYITIHPERFANNDDYSNFQLRIVPETETSFYGIPYNYGSVMHYDAWSLGDYGPANLVMEPKNPYFLSVMGYAPTANETDYEKLRRIYDCKESYPVVPPVDIPCVDEDSWNDCNQTYDYCDIDKTVIRNCRKTCGYCQWGQKPVSKQRPCKHWRTDCERFTLEDCKREWWLPRSCPITCGICKEGEMEPKPVPKGAQSNGGDNPSSGGEPTEPTEPTEPVDPNCKDEITYCNDYKNQCGQAGSEWMKEACPRTCKFC